MKIEKKSWYKSKTDWSIIVGTVGGILTIVSGMINGSIGLLSGLRALAIPVAAILAVFGIRGILEEFISRMK